MMNIRDQCVQTFFTDPRANLFAEFALPDDVRNLKLTATSLKGTRSKPPRSCDAGKLTGSVAVQTIGVLSDNKSLSKTKREKRMRFWDRILRNQAVAHTAHDSLGHPSVGIQVGLPTSYLVSNIVDSSSIRPLLPHEFRFDCYRRNQPVHRVEELVSSESDGSVGDDHDAPVVPSEVIDEVSETLASRFDSVQKTHHHPLYYQYSRSLIGHEAVEKLGNGGSLTDEERMCVEQFYKCMGCRVYIANSAALLFINDKEATHILSEWKRLYVGVPLWVFNLGLFKSKPRKLQLVIGEIGSGFILVDATIDWKSDVRHPRPGYITLKTKDEKTILALRFFSKDASAEFYKHFEGLRDDPKNADIFDSNYSSRSPTAAYKYAVQRISKKAISYPTAFRHLSSLRGTNNESLYSIRALL